jgi:hypothetical protein
MYFSIHWTKGDSGPRNISCVFLSYHYRCINFMASNQPVSRAAPRFPDLSIHQWHKQLCVWLARYSQLLVRVAWPVAVTPFNCCMWHPSVCSVWFYMKSAQALQLFLQKTNFFVCWTVSVPASYTIGTGSFRVVKRPGRGVGHTPPPSAEVQEKVEL